MKSKTEQMYAKMKPWRLFFVVAAPGMVSMFAMSIYSILEGIFVGQVLGEGALAAINIAVPLVMINFSLADLIGVGASAPISIALGKEDYKTANNVFSCAIILNFVASAAMGAIMFFAAVPLSRMMGADEELLDTAVRYLRVFALCGPITTIFFAMDNYLRICGRVKTSMFINIGCNVGTLGLLSLFLLVFDMSVVSVAFAICISMCTCSVVCLVPFLRNKQLLKFTKPKFHFSMIKEIAACGSPVFLNNIAGRVTSILMNISLMSLGVRLLGDGGGQTTVAVYAILMYASDLCWPLLYGIADSLAPALGYNWGAKNYDRVKSIAKCAYIGTAVVGLISTSFLFFFPGTIASWFANATESRLLEISTHAIRIFSFAYIFRWFGITTQSYFSAIGKPLQATIISVCTAFVFPVILLGALWNLQLDGIWLNFVGVTTLAAILSAILLARLTKEIKKRENETT